MLTGGSGKFARPFFFVQEVRMAKTNEAARGIFAPNPSRQDSKASTTNNIARSILETEAKQREAKTARLRALRLKMEAEAPPPPPKAAKAAPKKRATKPAAKATPKATAKKASAKA
jgi:hypothetical protein